MKKILVLSFLNVSMAYSFFGTASELMEKIYMEYKMLRPLSKINKTEFIGFFKSNPYKFKSFSRLNKYDKMRVYIEHSNVKKSKQLYYLTRFNKIDNGDEILINTIKSDMDLDDVLKILTKSDGYIQFPSKHFLKCLKTNGCELSKYYELSSRSNLASKILYKYPTLNQTTLNHKLGKFTEIMMDKYFSRSGWKKIEGEVGRNGVDGLYVKRNKDGHIKRLLFVESKYNKSQLLPDQMTKKWLLKKTEALIKKYPYNKDYIMIKNMIERDHYARRLWNMKIDGDDIVINLKKITEGSSGRTANHLRGPEKTSINYKDNQRINIVNPKNKFQKDMVNFYKEALSEI